VRPPGGLLYVYTVTSRNQSEITFFMVLASISVLIFTTQYLRRRCGIGITPAVCMPPSQFWIFEGQNRISDLERQLFDVRLTYLFYDQSSHTSSQPYQWKFRLTWLNRQKTHFLGAICERTVRRSNQFAGAGSRNSSGLLLSGGICKFCWLHFTTWKLSPSIAVKIFHHVM
jgi:hypothetical protein